MAKGDIAVVGAIAVTPTFKFASEDRTTTSQLNTTKPGEPVRAAGTGNNSALRVLGDTPTQAASTRFIGIAANESTETSTVDGHVDVQVVIPMVTIMEARATTPANVDTLAEWDLLQCDTVCFDGIAAIGDSTDTTPYTIDENEGDDPNDHAFVMIGWDSQRPQFIQFVVKPLVTLFGNNL